MDLRAEYTKMLPELQATKLIGGAEGAYAEAMLLFMPVMLDFLDQQSRKAAAPMATFEGLANVYSNLIVGALRGTVKRHSRQDMLGVMLDHINGQARQILGQRTSSIILPPGH